MGGAQGKLGDSGEEERNSCLRVFAFFFLLSPYVPLCITVYLFHVSLIPNPTICFLFPASLIFPQVGL